MDINVKSLSTSERLPMVPWKLLLDQFDLHPLQLSWEHMSTTQCGYKDSSQTSEYVNHAFPRQVN